MSQEKKPFLIDITEEVHKTVIVYADSDINAEIIAEALRRDEVIDLTNDCGSYVISRECCATGIADPEYLNCYERYNENGKVTEEEETSDEDLLDEAKQLVQNFFKEEYGDSEDVVDPFVDPTDVALAYTDYEEGCDEHKKPFTVNVKADLLGHKVRTYINDTLVSTQEFSSLRDMIDSYLDMLDYDDMVYITDEEWREYYYVLLQMDNRAGKFPPNREGINSVIFMFHPGCRIQLIEMQEKTHPVPAYMQGTVEYVDGAGHIHMKWDNGSSLSLIPGVDQFVKIK